MNAIIMISETKEQFRETRPDKIKLSYYLNDLISQFNISLIADYDRVKLKHSSFPSLSPW